MLPLLALYTVAVKIQIKPKKQSKQVFPKINMGYFMTKYKHLRVCDWNVAKLITSSFIR